ncbi:hypothetical protein BRADI_2g09600v3 [Brachypodium distachyon]|uniref:Peroxidase n=1 Tax=Brachypodium distachyon TaxID=15368 RepID=A0A0Q3QQL1_BRADI|nr:hypothetical protein BRADI_2g09600v3 [Brachypodium distachyon]
MARAVLALAAILALVASSCPAVSLAHRQKRQPPILARGLSLDFYRQSCPRAESIVRDFIKDAVRKDIGLAAGLLRLHFHDCFVQDQMGEQRAPPNLRLRPSAIRAISDIRDRLERECRGAVVSCSDILALAARDSVVVSGGPDYEVPLGRRDSPRFATMQDVIAGLPAPSSTVPALLAVLNKINLDATDLVAISGAHTVGLSPCSSFEDRLYPRQDPNMNPPFAARLRQICPAKGVNRSTVLDVSTPNAFDNRYYVNLVNREGLFVSDQDLFTNPATRPIVTRFARSQREFFEQYGVSVAKMGQINVLTGSRGQVRRNCSVRNPGTV